jgi:hypothetical protein
VTLAHLVPPIVLALSKHPVVDNYKLPNCTRSFPAQRRSAKI